jgi:hypothetical protein
MSHVMRAAVRDVGSFEYLPPCFFDVNSTKGRFAGKDKWLLGMALFIEFFEFLKSDATRASVFSFFDGGDFILKMDVFPF